MSMSTQNERELFEVEFRCYAKSIGYMEDIAFQKFTKGGEYIIQDIRTAWLSWKIGRAPLLFRIAELESRIDALSKDAEWQPIETAPKDGSRLWLCNDKMDFPVIGFWGIFTSRFTGNEMLEWVVHSDPHEKFMPAERGSRMIPTKWKPLAIDAAISAREGE